MKKKLLTVFLCALLSLALLIVFASCEAADAEMMDGAAMDKAPEMGDNIKLDINNSQIKDENSEYQRKIIKTANISAETKSYEDAMRLVEELCNDMGGYVESSSSRGVSLSGGQYNRYASYTLRIPAQNFDSFNTGLGGILNIVSSSSNADEVTSAYYDIKSRIEVLQLQKDSLQTMYDNYTDYSDVDSLISLQDKLFAVIEEIEAYETQLRLYDDKVSYSTIHLSINEVVDFTENTEDDTFFEKMGDSIIGGWDVFLSILTGLATVIAFLLPELVLAAGIITLAVFLSKKRKKNKVKKETQNPKTSTGENPYKITDEKE